MTIRPVFLPVVAFFVIAIVGPLVVPYNPATQDLMLANEGMSWAHWLGNDHLGRDTLARLVHGARTTLVAVTIILSLAIGGGVILGTVAGYVGGLFEEVVMRFVDFGLSVPSLIVALAVIGILGPSYGTMILALTVAWTPSYIRLSRAVIAAGKHQPHIEALQVLGASHLRILTKHLLPSALGTVLVYASGDAGVLALAIATLSFLGLGVQPPLAEWGQMLVDGLPYLEEVPRLVLVPGVALTLMVVAFNLMGEAIALGKTPRPLSRRLLRVRRREHARSLSGAVS